MRECVFCAPPGEGGAVLEGFTVRPAAEPVIGWMIVAPERHLEGWDALAGEDAAALGRLLRRTVAAVRAATRAPKVYVAHFAEVVPHFHVHVIPRPEAVPPEDRGARMLFERAPRAAPEAAAAAAREILARIVAP